VDFLTGSLFAIGVFVVAWLLRWFLTPFFGHWFQAVGVFVLIVVFLLGFSLLSVAWSDLWSDQPIYQVTRTIIKRSAATDPLKHWKLGLHYVTSIRVEQGFLGRLLDYGDLVFCTETQPMGALRFAGIIAPTAFKNSVEKLRNALPPNSTLITAGPEPRFE